jgi:hypothetical protein
MQHTLPPIPPHNILTTYAVALFGISMPRFSGAAAWYLTFLLCAVFPRYAPKNRTPSKGWCRSPEG